MSRDYDLESKDVDERQFAYDFDYAMHDFIIRSFMPFFVEPNFSSEAVRASNVLELGSFEGQFTEKLLSYFKEIYCVEASEDAATVARCRLPSNVVILNSLFEELDLPSKFDNVVLTHVLEHMDNPVELLKKIHDEWLSNKGRLFIACPNANAPSRQIAVKMGLISHNYAVTPGEEKHGHRCTYTLDTLERDATKAGLKVIHRSGIFFKALANFQWDMVIKEGIVSKEYLEGCFKLGQQYPDLCSSIFLVCEKN